MRLTAAYNKRRGASGGIIKCVVPKGRVEQNKRAKKKGRGGESSCADLLEELGGHAIGAVEEDEKLLVLLQLLEQRPGVLVARRELADLDPQVELRGGFDQLLHPHQTCKTASRTSPLLRSTPEIPNFSLDVLRLLKVSVSDPIKGPVL